MQPDPGSANTRQTLERRGRGEVGGGGVRVRGYGIIYKYTQPFSCAR